MNNDTLRNLAQEATPGPWLDMASPPTEVWADVRGPGPVRSYVACSCRVADAAFIAAANPQVVLGLLDEIDRLQAGGCARDQRTTQFCAEAVERDATIGQLRADLSALRIEHEAVCGLLAHTRKDRDEARTTISGYEAECAEIDQVLGRALGYPLAPGSEVTVCTGEHTPVSLAVDAATRLEKAERERDELRAALLNERGEGEPPSEGWAPVDATPGRWEHHARGWCCYRIKTREYIVVERGSLSGELAREKTAREAMRAADVALPGAKS